MQRKRERLVLFNTLYVRAEFGVNLQSGRLDNFTSTTLPDCRLTSNSPRAYKVLYKTSLSLFLCIFVLHCFQRFIPLEQNVCVVGKLVVSYDVSCF
jgi:hypothetical protein